MWDDTKIELLKKLWAEGISASNIAGILGEAVTKNAVIGKIHRLKLSQSGDRKALPRAERAPRKSSTPRVASAGRRSNIRSAARTVDRIVSNAAVENLAPEVPFELPPTTYFGSTALMGLGTSSCKWPENDPLASDFRFCGAHAEDGKAYCAHHQRRAYHAGERRRSAPTRAFA